MVLYFVGTILSLIFLLRRSEALSKSSLAVAGLGFVSHTLALLGEMVASGANPIMTFQAAMSFFAWALVGVFLGVALKRGLHVLGAFILPLAFLSLVSAIIAPAEAPELHPVFRAVWVHVTLSMLGTVGFAVAFVAGIMYVMQDRLLKSKQFNVLYFKLPPLDFLDNLNQRSILLGFPLLTLGILMGAVTAQITLGSYLSWNPEQVWALITWTFYFAVLLGRITIGWRAKKAAYLTIVGFAGVILTFLGVILKNPSSLTNL
jgi:cytochrome c-type biogenesis protein CcsB